MLGVRQEGHTDMDTERRAEEVMNRQIQIHQSPMKNRGMMAWYSFAN